VCKNQYRPQWESLSVPSEGAPLWRRSGSSAQSTAGTLAAPVEAREIRIGALWCLPAPGLGLHAAATVAATAAAASAWSSPELPLGAASTCPRTLPSYGTKRKDVRININCDGCDGYLIRGAWGSDKRSLSRLRSRGFHRRRLIHARPCTLCSFCPST